MNYRQLFILFYYDRHNCTKLEFSNLTTNALKKEAWAHFLNSSWQSGLQTFEAINLSIFDWTKHLFLILTGVLSCAGNKTVDARNVYKTCISV